MTPIPAAPLRAARQPVWVYSDGACRGNPGPSGAGWVIETAAGEAPPQRFLGQLFLGRRTNNEAEYLAATLGLRAAHELGARHVVLRVDSELLARQVQGIYRVSNARLQPLHAALVQQSRAFESFAVEHVRRAYNAAADAQANLAIDLAAR